MKHQWLIRSPLLWVGMLFGTSLALAQNNVTFQVNMKIKMLEGTFRPISGDIVRVAGGFNDWGNSTDTLSDANSDSIYTKTKSLATGNVEYKFLKTLRGGLDWEGGSNRPYTVVAGAQTLPVVYFDYDSVFTPPVNANVTYRVNMRVQLLEDKFKPQLGDIVRVAGSFNDWGNSTDTLRDVTPIDSIYQKTVSLLENSSVQYKFLKTPRPGSTDWEGGNNREYTVPVGGGTLPAPHFDYDSVFNAPVSGNLLWQVDVSAMQQLGWLVPGQKDSMELRGGFNGWNGEKMTVNQFQPGVYEILKTFTGAVGDRIDHKFFMDFDSAGATARFPGYIHSGSSATRDGFAYDHTAQRGDGNRQYELTQSGNLSTPLFYFSDINPKGIVNQNDTVRVTLRVNMGPATRETVPFTYATDSVLVVFEDALWRSSQVTSQGAFAQTIKMTRQGPNDSVYTVTFKVRGKTHYNIQYRYRYSGPTAGEVTEGGGLGVQNPFRSRFIQPLGPNSFPPSYTAPLDAWKKNAPLPAETAPFGTISGVIGDPDGGLPVGYKLSQNYPNPFNPTTKVKYTIPKMSQVTLKVYNLIGQEVATLVNEVQPAGNYIALFEANTLATGVYFYRLEAGNFREVKKMLLLK